MGLFGEKIQEFEALPEGSKPVVAIELEKGGTITLELYPESAAQHVASFISLIEKEYYNGLSFHRVVPGFVIQGGCPKGTGMGGPGYRLKAEFNDKPHLSGTLAMARSSDPDSGGSQFYICLAPQPSLDGNYTVFGQVTSGFELVQKVKQGDKMAKITVISK
jgi:peptidylprolyl isomerase/peptidyl-prolyl cis-trans isomerase B (cyclophilin B)